MRVGWVAHLTCSAYVKSMPTVACSGPTQRAVSKLSTTVTRGSSSIVVDASDSEAGTAAATCLLLGLGLADAQELLAVALLPPWSGWPAGPS